MYAYYLQNRSRIDITKVTNAILATTEYPQYYLDTETGTLKKISSREALGKWVKKIGKSRRYFHIERFDDNDRNSIAHEFITDILGDLATAAETKGTIQALRSGGWRAMEHYLRNNTDGWIHAWDQYIADEVWECAHEWLTESPYFSVTAEFEGCGDCAICELARNGEGNDHAKLQNAFWVQDTMQQVSAHVKQPKTAAKKRALQLKIELIGSKPLIWRRIIVPEHYTFFELHVAIQDAMGWFDCHLHQFHDRSPFTRKGTSVQIRIPHPDETIFPFDDEPLPLDERIVPLGDFLKKKKDAVWYEYDFGDTWMHKITLEKITPLAHDASLPTITAGENRCPFEDSGALFGYYEKMNILKDPKHPEHRFILEWVAEHDGYDIEDVNDEILTKLADVTQFNMNDIIWTDPKEALEKLELME